MHTENLELAAATEEKKRLEKSGSLHWFHWAIIFASLLLTLGAWSFTKTQHQAQIQERFDREANQITELVTERMLQYESILSSAAAAVESNKVHVDHTSWKKYAQGLDIQKRYPGINGIGFIDHLRRSELQVYLAAQRAERPDFNVHPVHAESELFPIIFIEPLEINKAAVGLDMAHEANRFNAAKSARDTGQPQITGPITLVQDAQKTPGFLLFSPVYSERVSKTAADRQEHFLGFVYAPFIVNKLMRGTLDNDKRQVGLKISDGNRPLFDENRAGVDDFDPSPLFMVQKTVDVYGRTWTFDIRSKMSFARAAQTNKPRMILTGGLAIDALLLALFSLLAQANRRAISFAGRMADAQQADAARLNNIIENMVDGMITSGREGRILSFNKACECIFGYSASEVIGQRFQFLAPGLNERQYYRTLRSGNLNSTIIQGRRKDGTSVPLEIAASMIEVDGSPLYNITVRDIATRQQADEKLRQAMDDLIHSNEELEKFAYVASHDLKSPLRGIDNLTKWLEEDLDPVLDEENRLRIETLRSRVSRMDNLLDDLLQYSRAGFSVKTMSNVNCGQLVRGIWDILDAPPGFELEVDPVLDDVDAAQMPLEQILHNLINNAIKHHDKDAGIITVSHRDLGDKHKFSVVDNGPGIAPEFHEKVFEMFQTLRSRDEVEGSGMGLALVRKFVYLYGGALTLNSEVGHGSEFTFTLPKVLPLRKRPTREDFQRSAA